MKPLSPQRRNFILELALVVLICTFTAVLYSRGVMSELDNKYYDMLVRLQRPVPAHRTNVVIVCIDQNSLTGYSRDGQGWPWPRDFHARLVRYLTDCGAKAIVFDMILSEQDPERLNAPRRGDEDFGEAITASGRTILVIELKEGIVGNFPVEDGRALFKNSSLFENIQLPNHDAGVFPIPVLAGGAEGFGLANAVLDSDGIVRRYPLVMKYRGEYIPSLAFAVARVVKGDSAVTSWIDATFRKRTFVDNEGNLRLHWYGKGDIDGSFKYHSYRRIMAASINEEITGIQDTIRAHFKNKIVLVGSDAPGLLDLKSTPVSRGEAYPGMEIHATAIENFLADEFISTVPRWIVILIMAAAAAALFALIKTTKSLRLFIAAYFVCMAAEFSASWFLLLRDIWLPSFGMYLSTTLVFVGLVISGYFTETREKRLVRRYFERYVNDSVLEQILANPNAVDFKSHIVHATIMATDIKDFTRISEEMDPDEVVSRLNDYLSEVSEVLINHGAFINKYIGDAILALYGAFKGDHAHCEQACHAALAAMKVIARKAEEAAAAGNTPFITRFGLNTGRMTMGNIGSARKIEYTVIGDAVNSAFRLESLNKFYGTRILASEFTREGAGNDFEFRLLDALQFKGKDRPMRVYELIGEKGSVDEDILRRRNAYQRAFGLYTARKFEEALEEFARLREEGDDAAKVLEKRCRLFLETPPAEGWTGVWRMDEK